MILLNLGSVDNDQIVQSVEGKQEDGRPKGDENTLPTEDTRLVVVMAATAAATAIQRVVRRRGGDHRRTRAVAITARIVGDHSRRCLYTQHSQQPQQEETVYLVGRKEKDRKADSVLVIVLVLVHIAN